MRGLEKSILNLKVETYMMPEERGRRDTITGFGMRVRHGIDYTESTLIYSIFAVWPTMDRQKCGKGKGRGKGKEEAEWQ